MIVATYFYFLIFAQFAFVELLNADLKDALKPMMAAMAFSGIIGSLTTPLILKHLEESRTLTLALLGCASMSALCIPAHTFVSYLGVSIGTGLSLGLLTVTLTANLRALLHPTSWGLGIGTGTGLAYFCANLPPVFATTSANQAIIASAFVVVALPAARKLQNNDSDQTKAPPSQLTYFPYAVLVFLALVWLDSAAFFIIQHTQSLKESTWGDVHLWRNGFIHLLFALLAGFLLQKRSATILTAGAFIFLALASLCLNHPELAVTGGWLYPAGVSLYSTALVACPVYLARFKNPAWAAAILYSIAGWFGSANGIGMAENLNYIPLLFLIIAGIIFLVPLLKKHKAKSAIALALITIAASVPTKSPSSESSLIRGRQVYLSEGCIHCHSRYVRPGSPDELLWGPLVSLDEITKESPVIIGNRRSGPDLLNIGNRRSRAWLKQHFLAPRSLSQNSPMPAYPHLFQEGDTRGEDLIDFITERGIQSSAERYETIQTWQPATSASTLDGRQLFTQHCASCHGPQGRGDGPLSKLWTRPPANLHDGPFLHSATPDTLTRIIKFGIMGTDMPGHETLTDPEVVALTQYIKSLR